jgi:electron transfer flavoprotein beta subunit
MKPLWFDGTKQTFGILDLQRKFMHFVVCIKQILDPEIPPADFRLDVAAQQATPGSAAQVISIFDENAIEVALQARDKSGSGKITALSIGPPSAIDALRKALSMRVDDAVLLPAEDYPNLDAQGTAKVLGAAIRKLEAVDVVLCGREAGDWHSGVVPGFLAAKLGWAYTSLVASCEIESNQLRLRRQTEDGWEIVQSAIPAVVSVTNDGGNLPRIPKVKDNMLAFRRQIPSWPAAQLNLAASDASGANGSLEKKGLYIPKVDRTCEFVAGENSTEKAQKLIEKLAALHVI